MSRSRSAQVAALLSFPVIAFLSAEIAHGTALVSGDVSLHSSTLIDIGFSSDTLSDTGVLAGSGREICIPNDSTGGCASPPHPATNIGGDGTSGSTPLLPGEYIDLVSAPASIIVSIANGDTTSLRSGYAGGSYYLFSNLIFDTAEPIIGVA